MLCRRAEGLARSNLSSKTRILSVAYRPYTAITGLVPSSTRPFAKPRAAQHVSLPWLQASQRRGAKRKTTLQLDDIQQGAIQSEALLPQNDAEPEYPPLLQQVRNNMLKFSHCVLLTRVGGFYEVLDQHSRSTAILTKLTISYTLSMQMSLRPY